MLRHFTWTLSALFLFGGCTTGVVIPDVQRPLNYIKYVVSKEIPGGVRKTSENGREFMSNYFPPNGRFDQDASKARERSHIHVLVLGDRRPYKVEVRVPREIRDEGRYVKVGDDRKLAEEIARRIRTGLANRREDLNFIDDFRAF